MFEPQTKSPLAGSLVAIPRTATLLLLGICLVALSACDLRRSNEELVARAIRAADAYENQAAIIDLKTVLQRDPQFVDARVALGRVYLQVAEPYAAEKELRKAMEFGVPKSRVVVYLGEALLAQHVYDVLLAEVVEADAVDDEDRVLVRLIRADAALALGRLDEARQLYVAVLESDPDNATAYLGMASVYGAENRPEQALASIERAIEVAPDSAPAWMARGAYRLSRRSPDAAEPDIARALELATEQRDGGVQQTALAALADIALLREDVPAATHSAERLQSIAPDSMSSRYTTARVAFAGGDIDQAVVLLQGILKDVPDFRQAHLLYGAVSRAKGNLAQAEMYLSSAVNAWPENAEARRLLADVRLKQRKFRDATDALEPLLEEDVAIDDHLLAAAGIVKLQTGEQADGVDLFRRSAEADPANLERRMDLAAIYLAVGQVDDAVAVLESLAGTDADQRRLDVLNVLSLWRQGDLDAAIARAGELIRRSPGNVELHTVIGGLHEERGDLQAARRSFQQALRLDPENVGALLRLGQIDVAEMRYANARLKYRRALQMEPESVPVILQMARLAMLEGDVASSVSWLERARHFGDEALLPRIQLGMLYLSQGRQDEALRVAEEALAIDAGDARALNLMGVTKMATGDYETAARQFAAAVRTDGNVAAYRFNHARAELARGDQPAALQILVETFEAHPDHIPTAMQLAGYHLQKGDFPAAMTVSQRLQAARPDDAAGLALQGDVLAGQGRLDAAVAMYDRASAVQETRDLAVRSYRLRVKAGHREPYRPLVEYLASNPQDATARMMLAEIYHANGEAFKAATEYDRLLQANPDNVVALNNLAWLMFDAGDPQAIEKASEAYRLVPDNAAIADTYGWILLAQGKSDEASEILRQAAAAMPQNAEIQYHFGVSLYETGNLDEADAVLERVVASEQAFASRSEAEALIAEIRGGEQ